MIYLDVTSSCKSPMNTGVQQAVRSLYRSLSGLVAVTPVVWDRQLGTYCKLSTRESGFLIKPFGRSGAIDQPARLQPGDAEPGRRANPIPVVSNWTRAISHRWNRLDFPRCLRSEDTLFVPEIFQDNRIELLTAWADHAVARLVAICHDAIAWRRPAITPPERQGGFLGYLEALSRFDAVMAVSQETRHDLLTCWTERGCATKPVIVEAWPVNHAAGERQTSRPVSDAPRTVVCVGTFEPRKNHLGLLEAAAQLWRRGLEFELILIGRTTAQWGDRVLEVVRALEQEGRAVRWLRHVDDRSLHAAYEACEFTVFPSFVEGFGLPILESLWYGRPCVCGRNGAIGEITRGGGCLTVDQTQPASMAEGMERLLTDPALLRHLTEEAVRRSFDSWEALAARLLPLLQRPAAP